MLKQYKYFFYICILVCVIQSGLCGLVIYKATTTIKRTSAWQSFLNHTLPHIAIATTGELDTTKIYINDMLEFYSTYSGLNDEDTRVALWGHYYQISCLNWNARIKKQLTAEEWEKWNSLNWNKGDLFSIPFNYPINQSADINTLNDQFEASIILAKQQIN